MPVLLEVKVVMKIAFELNRERLLSLLGSRR
jgi:hypothetical protein